MLVGASERPGEDAMANLPDPVSEPTLRVEQAGELLGISRGSAYEAARCGELPVLRFGKRLVVPTAALLELLQVGGKPPARGDVVSGDSPRQIQDFGDVSGD